MLCFNKKSYQPPRRDELGDIIGMNKDEVDEVFISLINSSYLVKLNEEVYLSKDAYELALVKLREYLISNNSISIGEYRDLLNTNRKVGLALLEYFDLLKITKRDKDIRVLN